LAGAIASAAARLVNCITNLVRDTLNDLAREVLDGAAKLYDQALGIYEDFKDDLYEQSGIKDIMNDVQKVRDQIENMKDSVESTQQSINSLERSRDQLLNTTLNIPLRG